MLYIINIISQSVENPSSQQAERINSLFNSFNIAAGAMLLLVISLVFYICIKFKQKSGDITEPKQIAGNKKMEALMIGVPVFLLAWFFYQTVIVIHAVAPPVNTGDQPDVIITGHQWWWEVEYPASKVITANEVHLPAGKHLLLEMRSADVIHSWWVPELGNKMDLIPGRNNYLWLDINKPGQYIGTCSEFCGAEHAWMRINVIAQNENDFNAWLKVNAENASSPHDSAAITGSNLFQTKTCASCHRIRGTVATAGVGPDLTHLGGRQDILAGLMKNNKQNLFNWINHPQAIKPDAHMPDFIFNRDSLEAIVHYLVQLK